MKIQYLGTAAAEGWPAVFCNCENCRRAREAGGRNIRTRPQALIDDGLLMDLGPDTYLHALAHGLALYQIHSVLVTHSHTDHFYGTELILKALPYAYDGDLNPLTIYGNEAVEAMFRRVREVEDDSQNFDSCLRFSPVHAFEPFSIPGYRVLPLKARHDPKENCLLYAVESTDGKRLLYGNDTAFFSDETLDHLRDLRFDYISLDCTMGGTPDGGTHMGLEGCLRLRERLLEMGCADQNTRFVITHFSHNGGLLYDELCARTAPYGIQVAYDGMTVEF